MFPVYVIEDLNTGKVNIVMQCTCVQIFYPSRIIKLRVAELASFVNVYGMENFFSVTYLFSMNINNTFLKRILNLKPMEKHFSENNFPHLLRKSFLFTIFKKNVSKSIHFIFGKICFPISTHYFLKNMFPKQYTLFPEKYVSQIVHITALGQGVPFWLHKKNLKRSKTKRKQTQKI